MKSSFCMRILQFVCWWLPATSISSLPTYVCVRVHRCLLTLARWLWRWWKWSLGWTEFCLLDCLCFVFSWLNSLCNFVYSIRSNAMFYFYVGYKDRYSWRHERRKGQSQTKLTPGQEGARRSISCISAGIKQDVCFPAGEAVRMSAVLEALPAQGDWYANAGKVLRPACRRCLLHNVLVVTSWPRYVCVFIRSSEHRASYGLERCCRLIPAKNAAKIDRVCVFCWVNRRD